MLWDFSKKEECNNIIRNWQMSFQVSDFKGKSFLNLLDNDFNFIEPSYIRGGPWIKHFGHSNSLCARVMRAITNHALISEYHQRFFPPSLGKILVVHAANTQLSQDIMSSMNVGGLTTTGI